MTLPLFTLQRDPLGQLVCTLADGTVHIGVLPVRAFPIASPHESVSLTGADGKELAWIARLADLPPAERALIEEELRHREFMPEIRRLRSVSTYSTPSTWQVETDRGPTELLLRGEEDIRRLPGERAALLITSSDGISFLIRDLSAIDRHSRKMIERFL